MKLLYKVCAGYGLLPTSLHFELPGDTTGDLQYYGRSAVILKRECGGREFAIKVRPGIGPKGMTQVSHRPLVCILVRIDEPIVPLLEVLQGGHNLESPPTPKCVTASGGDHAWEPIRHGVRVDDKR